MLNGLSKTELNRLDELFDLSEDKEMLLAIWIIGRPAAGKTTAATLLCEELKRRAYRVELVDGDVVRSAFDGLLGYSAANRLKAFMRYVNISQLMQSRGIIPVVATIGGYQHFREIVRSEITNPRFIYLDCPFEVAAQRDQKGLYAKALAGEIKDFFDVDIPFESPTRVDLRIDTSSRKPQEVVARIMNHFEQGQLFLER